MQRKASGPTKFEWWYISFLLVMFAALPFVVGGQATGADSLNPTKSLEHLGEGGDQIKQTIATALYAGCAVLLARHTRLRALLFLGYPLLFLLLWSFASIAWSVDPGVSFRRCVALTGTVVLGAYLGLRFDPDRMLRLLTYSAAIVLVASLVIGVIAPSRGLDFEGRLRGVFAHKNAIGDYSAIALLVAVGRFLERRSIGKLATVGAGMLGCAAMVCMALAGSAAVIPVLLSALATLLVVRRIRRRGGKIVTLIPLALCVATGAAVVIYGNWGSLIELLGKDRDMSGRTVVWQFVIRMIFEKPFIGYGFQSFWEGYLSPGAVFWKTTHLGVPHAHDGYLQLTLDTGGIGLLLFAIGTVQSATNLFKLLPQAELKPPFVEWAIGYLVFYLITNISESWLWVGNVMPPILFIYIVVRSNILVRQARVTSHTQSFQVSRAEDFVRQSVRESYEPTTR